MGASSDSTARLREHALALVDAAVAACDPAEAIRRSLRIEDGVLHAGSSAARLPPGRIILLAVGKAALPMARAAIGVLGSYRVEGAVTAPRGSARSGTGPVEAAARRVPGSGDGPAQSPLEVWESGHPLPDVGGLAAAGDALARARAATADDLVLCLLSGGASAMWAAPAPGLTLGDLREAGLALLRSGAPIEAVNTVRRHLSAIAGGHLAAAAAPAPVLTLAVSDVIAAQPSAIGSGPTLPDPTTFADALEVVRRYRVALPPPALRYLEEGAGGARAETPDRLANLVGFEIVLDVGHAVAAAAAEAERLGYAVRVVSTALAGEAREVGAAMAAEALAARPAGGAGVALLWGGETTVTVRGGGAGGRNQELALAAAVGLRGEGGVCLASVGTDGRDGPTDAAGAIVDGGTVARGEAAGLNPDESLGDNDSHRFLAAAGDLVVTGPTGTNVNDVVVALLSPG